MKYIILLNALGSKYLYTKRSWHESPESYLKIMDDENELQNIIGGTSNKFRSSGSLAIVWTTDNYIVAQNELDMLRNYYTLHYSNFQILEIVATWENIINHLEKVKV